MKFSGQSVVGSFRFIVLTEQSAARRESGTARAALTCAEEDFAAAPFEQVAVVEFEGAA